MRTAHIDRERLASDVGQEELLQIAGDGHWNAADGQGPAIDEVRLADAIGHANELVESYVRGRYPNGVNSALLTAAAADIVRYRLRSKSNSATLSDEVRKRYEDAMRLLRDVQAGKQQLTDDTGAALATAEGAGGTVMTSDRNTFGYERSPLILSGYVS